jgi:hypothetical protein
MSYWNAFARTSPNVPALRLDGGSLFNTGDAGAPVSNRWILEGTLRSGLDAINLTLADVPVWQELGDLAAGGLLPKEQLAVPLVSANVVARVPNFPRFDRYRVKEVRVDGKSFRIGITGLLLDPEERLSRREFKVAEPQAAIREVLEELKDKVDYRIVLTEMDIGKVISMALAVPGIELIVLGHNYHHPVEPQEIGDSLVVVPINEGRALTEVRLAIGAPAGQPRYGARLVGLDRTVPDDPAMGEMLRKAQAEIEAFRRR